jgi:hypothetical protein
VSRRVNAHGKISLAGFSYAAGASYAGEPVEVVTAGRLADILHAGVVVATHVQRSYRAAPCSCQGVVSAVIAWCECSQP